MYLRKTTGKKSGNRVFTLLIKSMHDTTSYKGNTTQR